MPTDLQTCFELERAKSRYCRMMDMKDWAGVADLFAEDLVFDLGGGHDAAPIIGRDAALQAVQSSIVDAVTVHQVHSPEFDINGDEARVVWAASSLAAAKLEKVCLAEPMADPLPLAVDACRAAVTSTGWNLLISRVFRFIRVQWAWI